MFHKYLRAMYPLSVGMLSPRTRADGKVETASGAHRSRREVRAPRVFGECMGRSRRVVGTRTAVNGA